MSTKTGYDSHPERKMLASISWDLLLRLFPFGLIISKTMTILGCGEKLNDIWKYEVSMIGEKLTKCFKVRRPKGIPFTWTNVSS